MKRGISPLVRIAAATLLAAAFGLTGSCKSDPTSDFTLALSVDRISLTSDGSNFATVRVTILDQNGYPPPIGSTVLLQAQNGDVGNSGQDTGDSLTDAAGTAQFTVSCTGTSSIQILALYEGATGFLLEQLDCQPAPAGDWQLLLSATPRSIAPGGTSSIVIDAVNGQGAPVPTGTAVTFSINEPNPGARFRTGSGSRQILQTQDPSGRLTNVVIAPPTEENFTVCASFTDQRFGAGERCITITVSVIAIREATCLGVYAPSQIAADGESTSTLTFSVFDNNGQPAAGAEITAVLEAGEFLEDPDDLDSGVDEIDLDTDSSGVAEVIVLSPTRTGSADVEAFADFAGLDDPLACEFTDELVFFPPPTCVFDPIPPLGLGETANLRVCFDNLGVAVAAGKRVEFQLTTAVGGAALTATTAFTTADGCVVTGLATGSAPGGITVRARMPFGQSHASCQSEAVVQSGGVASANQMTLACNYRNIGAYLTRNGVDITNACSMNCLANVLDQFNNPVEGTTVYFTSEAGSISARGTTDASGNASATFQTRGQVPRDVPQLAGEPLGTGGGIDSAPNPRDSVVTIVASTVGQEPFNDDNGNGVYDEGEFFVDLSEPFVDANEDDEFNAGGSHESFTDVAVDGRPLNGEFDAPNEVWDPFTQIWAVTHVVYSGGQADPQAFRFRLPGSSAEIPIPARITTSGTIVFRPRDEFGNGLSSGTTFSADTTCERGEVEVFAREGDSFGVVDVARQLRHFADGREVSADSDNIDFGRYFTSVLFGNGGPSVDVVFSVDRGFPEDCTITVSWTEQGTADCADGAREISRTFLASLPLSE